MPGFYFPSPDELRAADDYACDASAYAGKLFLQFNTYSFTEMAIFPL